MTVDEAPQARYDGSSGSPALPHKPDEAPNRIGVGGFVALTMSLGGKRRR